MHTRFMLDLSKEAPIGPAKAAKLPEYARDGKHSNPVTVWRHMTKGVCRNGQRVYLESAVIGGRRVTTREAVRRFMERLTLDPADIAAPTPSQERDAHRNASRRLELAGI